MSVILSGEFGLYRIVVADVGDDFFYDIQCLDDSRDELGEHYSTAAGYERPYDAFRAGMIRLASLFWRDLEDVLEIKSPSIEGERAGNGIRTHDILLGNFPLSVKSTDGEVQS